jgi:hypothetical protein
MYRLIISRMGENDLRIRCKTKPFEKHVRCNARAQEYAYTLVKRMQELHRDCLYSDYGESVLTLEIKYKKELTSSILSAHKRARCNG